MKGQQQCLTAVNPLHTSPRSMLGKRKRSVLSPNNQESDPELQPSPFVLTRANLRALSEQTQRSSSTLTQNYPYPFERMLLPTPSAEQASTPKKSKTKTATTGLAADAILGIYNIHLGRNLPMPKDLDNLVRKLQTPREAPITPNSQWVKGFKANPEKLLEPTEIYAMMKYLVYNPKFHPGDLDGEPMVAMELDQQWTAEVPKPPGYTDDQDLQAAMAKYGLPSRAQPDAVHGYSADALPEPLLTRVKALPEALLVRSKRPWMPWQTTQWKTPQGNQFKAEQQTRRDTSTSNECMYQFFRYNSSAYDPEPSPACTCVFSLQVYDEYCRFRIHWRRVDENGKVSYEGDVLRSAFFDDELQIFNLRSCVLEVLKWARGTRLDAIKRKLLALSPVQPVPIAISTPPRNAIASSHHSQNQSRALIHSPPTPSGHQSKRARTLNGDEDEESEDELG